MSPIPKEDIEHAFPYYDEYAHIIQMRADPTLHRICSITFNVGRYGTFKHTISFLQPCEMTIHRALRKVEKWLTNPLSNADYERLRASWDLEDMDPQHRSLYMLRGDCLGSAKIIDDIKIDSEGNMRILCIAA